MSQPLSLKLLTLLCANALLLSCSEPQSQPTTGVTADQSQAPQLVSDQSENTFQRAGQGRVTVNGKPTVVIRAAPNIRHLMVSMLRTWQILKSCGAGPGWISSISTSTQSALHHNWNAAPLIINGVGYVTNGVGLVEAFHPGTGETLWVQEPPGGAEGLPGASTRGVAYWSEGDEQRLFVQRGTFLYALNPEDGKTFDDFGVDGRVDLQLFPVEFERFRWGGVPMVVRDVVVIGQAMSDTFPNKEAFRGDVHAFDVRTGTLRWTYHTIPQEGEFGTDTWQDRSWSYTGHAPVWALFSADEELGLVYMPISSATNDMYGGHRIGDNLFSQSLVAVNAETGERVWHYQTVHHGLWDYDPPAAPILMDINVEGREIKAVAQLTKQAFVFVFDRETGEPVWDIEERPVPQSDVPGEVTAATQPFPPAAPFDLQGSTEENLIDFTPEFAHRRWRLRVTTSPGRCLPRRRLRPKTGLRERYSCRDRRAVQMFRERLSTLRPVCSIYLPSPPPSSPICCRVTLK